MMNDYSKYSYARTLQFFEAYYPYDVENVQYAEVLLSMNHCSSIDELISIRECLKEKIKEMDNFKNISKLSKELIEEISNKSNTPVVQFSLKNIQDNMRYDVNSCYDENVFRIFKERKKITANSCGECLINLSNCRRKSPYIDLIISEAKERANIDVTNLLYKIVKRYNLFGEHWNNYKKFKEGMNGYNSAKKEVEDDLEYLKQFNWRLLPWQKSLYSKIDREEQKKKKAINLKKQREKKERQIKLEGEQEELDNSGKTIEIISRIIGILIFIGIMFFFLSAGEEGANWFLAIILILALMKAGILK